MTITAEEIKERLYRVMDPEVDCDIVTMGLIYDICVEENSVHILHTLTSMLCPLGPQIDSDIRKELLAMGIENVEIELTFDPPWEPPADLRTALGLP